MSSSPYLFTGLGAAAAVFLTASGAGVASVPSAIFAQHAQGFKCVVPIMQAGVLAIYGCIIGIILAYRIQSADMTEVQGYCNFSAGLAVGLSCLGSGVAMALFVATYLKMWLENNIIADDNSISPSNLDAREALIPASANTRRPPLVVTTRFIVAMIFLEAIGLYGLVVALFLSGYNH